MNAFAPRAEIDLSAIVSNAAELKRRLSSSTQLMAVIKANGYGHGASPVARAALEGGATALAVARTEEGIELREQGISAPILLLGPCAPEDARDLLEYSLTPSIGSLADAQALSEKLHGRGRLKVHLKIDTGMGRWGFFAQSCVENPVQEKIEALARQVQTLRNLPTIQLEGIFTHFSHADESQSNTTRLQFSIFQRVLRTLKQLGICPSVCHAANSAAILNHSHTHLDLVRSGIALYGLGIPRSTAKVRLFRPALSLKARIAHLKQVPAGTSIGYGDEFRTRRPTLIATVPVGYADGYDRAHSERGHMLVRGQQAPIVGRVCMDFTMLDVGTIPGVTLGDEVVIFGKQGAAELHVDDLAKQIGTISHELVASLTSRVRKMYFSKQPDDLRISEPAENVCMVF